LGGLEKEMGAGAEVMHQVVPLLEAPFHRCAITNAEVIVEVVGVTTASLQPAVSLRVVVEVAVEVSDLVSFRFQLPIILPLMF
jgi:protein phosphatase PTC2/3